MVCDSYKDFLLNVYTECNVHLREQTKKRDQVITFYLVLLSFFLTSYKSILEDFPEIIISIILIVLSIIGFICLTLIINLRSWHIQYYQCCEVLNKVFTCDQQIENNDELVNFISSNKTTDRLNFKGIENKILIGFSFLSFIPEVIFCVYLMSKFNYYHMFFIISMIVLFILYEIYSIYLIKKTIYNANDYITWIINFKPTHISLKH